MSAVERHDSSLAEDEAVIVAGLASFVEVGNALMRIRDERKYLGAGFDTFEDYCEKRWDLGRSHAYRQIDAARVHSVLSPIGDTVPANEGQARALTTVLVEHGEEALVEAWRRVLDQHDGDQPITAAEIDRVLRGAVPKRTSTPPAPPATSDAMGAGQADPDEWETYARHPTIYSFFVRARVRDALRQTHNIVVARMADATVQADAATHASLVGELKAVGVASREGAAEDLRVALLAVAASAILLGERADRGPEPERGEKRSSTERWEEPDYRISQESI